MKVFMLKTVNGKVNGVVMGPYNEGFKYDLDTERAQLFIGSAMAEPVIQYTPISEVTNIGDTVEFTAPLAGLQVENPEAQAIIDSQIANGETSGRFRGKRLLV